MKTVIVLLGPTGVGKTGASIALAQRLGTEIISADSMQIYRGMDIGTAKLTPEERHLVRHHMIDIISPSEPFSAGQYLERVRPVIDALHAQGKTPVVVGGTGLYIRAMTRGLFAGPAADERLRDELIAMEEQAPGTLRNMLERADPEAAVVIAPNDLRRTIRALEVSRSSNEPISRLQRERTEPLPYRFIKIGLTRDRKELYQMINSRVDVMVEAGLIDEVRRLLEDAPGKIPLQAIGYKEIARFLRGELSREEAIRLVKRHSRHYARRQFIWFRKEADIAWLDITGVFDGGEICGRMLPLLGGRDAAK